MKTVIKLENTNSSQLPKEFANDDVRFTESLVKHFIEKYTSEGDVVFDPFAGFGTTLIVAEAMNRVACGVEIIPERVAYIKKLLKDPSAIIQGDSRRLSKLGLPLFNLSITSPPYMTKNDHAENPFDGYRTLSGNYESYLNEFVSIYSQIRKIMKSDAHIVIEAPSIKKDGIVTTLAWDIAAKLSNVLHFDGEIVVEWDNYGSGYNHSYCLVFSK